jgi:hypothetical protein
MRIWSKWAKYCLNVTSAREPTFISQMGIQKRFHIWNEEFWFSKITFIRGYPESTLNDMNLIEMGKRVPQCSERSGTHLHLSNGYPKIILYF